MAVFTTLLIASLAISAYSAYKAGKSEKAAGKAQHKAADSQAELADYNAEVADLQATDAIDRGEEAANNFRSQIRGAIGTQRAGFAGSNIDVGYGSAVDVQADASYLGELDALTLKTNAAREAWGYKVQAEDLRKRATIARKEGVYLEKAGNERGNAAYISGAANLLGGTASLMSARYGYNQARSGAA